MRDEVPRNILAQLRVDVHNRRCDSGNVTQAARKLLEDFEALPDADRSELLAELLRRVATAPHDLPTDEDLVSAADQLFVDLDRREQS